jgi:thiamine biosynthesis protein ThiS
MTITVNGERRDDVVALSVAALIREMGGDPMHVAVMLNDAILKRDDREGTLVADGDRVEIVTLARGG